MPKRIETKVTSGRNGGVHCTKSYKKACSWIDSHSFNNAQLWHLVMTGSADREAYESALDRIVERLRDAGMETEYKAAYELCPEKGFHRHCFLLIDAKEHKPAAILRYRETGWLVNTLNRFGLKFHIAPPKGSVHLTRNGKQKKYAYVPKTPGAVLDDCKQWISYAFKTRTKAGVEAPIYSSSRKRKTKATILPITTTET